MGRGGAWDYILGGGDPPDLFEVTFTAARADEYVLRLKFPAEYVCDSIISFWLPIWAHFHYTTIAAAPCTLDLDLGKKY